MVEVVKPLRDNLDACLIFPSMPEVMRLNKVRKQGRRAPANQLSACVYTICHTTKSIRLT